ncbi:MBL fold metallo-hydrolase [Nocardioides speluncae]|uniref:MBL fold metallo-hydrolase n=1 Tax=Nocardioides speluncae TaxID=2670337 RepID=UPI000D69187B|nr:MBL fold metallo-hydrolase [Nocardioides speluncae]
MADFTEVGDRVWVANYDWFDLNVTLVGGERGLLVVDTHSSEPAAKEVVADVRRLGAGEVIGIINTHEHFDHTFGNAIFRDEYGELPIHATEWAAEHTISAGERMKRNYEKSDDPHRDEVMAAPIVPADHTFSSVGTVDLGDRAVELIHPGRGHTAGDLVVLVPDANVLAAGDLIEESAPPVFGGDCHPLDWPTSLDLVLQLLNGTSVVVPGHGAVVDRAFVEDQRSDIGVVAETIRDLAGRGIPLDEALAAAEWPFPADGLAKAVRRGYEQLPRHARQLPLI